MVKIVIAQDKCKGCLLCMHFCPRGLIQKGRKLNKRGVQGVEFKETGQCLACSQCAIICPDCCIEVYK